MSREIKLVIFVIVALFAVAALSSALYTVKEPEQVVITQFGKPVGKPITTPGLKVKMPFVQTVHAFDKRFLEWDGDPNQIPTRDKRFIWVDSYARWRITDPLLFFQRLHDERGAQSRLDDILDGETRNTIAKHQLIDLVRSTNRPFVVAEDVAELSQPEAAERVAFGRDKLTNEVLMNARRRTGDLGIEILDFRFKQINYVDAVRQEVYARMISERKRIAERYRSEGAGEAARIAGEKEREMRVIESEAYRKAQEVRGKADAEAADIYAAAYNRDPEFYRFLKSMGTLEQSIDGETVLVLSTDSELLRYLNAAR
jgi:membrane protease subunit HflC